MPPPEARAAPPAAVAPGAAPLGAIRLAPAARFRAPSSSIWEGACRLFQIPSFLLPSPSAIVAAGFRDSPAAVWLGHIGATLRVALMGFALAIAVSIPLAVALVNSRLLSRTLYPILDDHPVDADRRHRADHRA